MTPCQLAGGGTRSFSGHPPGSCGTISWQWLVLAFLTHHFLSGLGLERLAPPPWGREVLEQTNIVISWG